MKLLQVDTKGETVADLGPPVPDNAPDLEQIEVTAKSVPRPSLEVESEVHAHLVPRIEAHLRRIEAWDARGLNEDRHGALTVAITSIRDGFRSLGDTLDDIALCGFVAKSTASSRKRAALKCAVGKRVQLRVDIGDSMCGLFYTAEELSALTLAKVGESSVLLVTAGGREIGPLPFAHVELVDG